MKDAQLHILPLVQMIRQEGPVLLLESQMDGHSASRKSFLAGKPKSWIKTEKDKTTISRNGREHSIDADPWQALKQFRLQNDWIFGYFGYDLKNSIEELSSENASLIDVPDMFFFCPELLFEIDNDGVLKMLKGKGFPNTGNILKPKKPELRLSNQISKNEYIRKVTDIQNDIYEGEYSELNYTHALSYEFSGDYLQLYDKMREINEVPFAAYLEAENFAVCSSSPERFLARDGNKVWSQPIKGTLKRRTGSTEEILQLQNSAKDRAENLMIVDLVRNDLNRVCLKNSVQVSELFEIQTFKTVHQMVSTVEGRVDEETDSVDIIKACFPMGSMTGAPKIAAMKAIDKYENYRRGIYSGAMGYIDPNNNFDFNVLIRTAIIKSKKVVFPVGGAITSDSDPASEWEETLIKAKGITDLLGTL